MLKKIVSLNYKLKLESGLHIGGGSDLFDIGGTDSPVIKNPINGQPYIPGSSIKGKVRSLLGYHYGKIVEKNQKSIIVISNPTILSIFQPVEENSSSKTIQISRAIFRDAVLTEDSAAELQKYLGAGIFTEVKVENKIDPLRGVAKDPRFIERVPAGAVFAGQVLLQVFDDDNEEALKNALLEGFHLIETSYLGGSGTRGYGRISFTEGPAFREVNGNENI